MFSRHLDDAAHEPAGLQDLPALPDYESSCRAARHELGVSFDGGSARPDAKSLHERSSSMRELQAAAADAAERQKKQLHASQELQRHTARELAELKEKCHALSDDVSRLEQHIAKGGRDRVAEVRHEQLQSRITACESSETELRMLCGDLQRMCTFQEAHQKALGARLERLEDAFDESADQQRRATDAWKLADARISGESSAREAQQAALLERLGAAELDSAAARARCDGEVRQALAKVEQAAARLAALEAQGGALADARQAQARVVQDAVARAAHESAMAQRVAELEAAFGAASERQSAQAGALESSLVKLEQLHHRVSVSESHIEALSDSLKAHGSPTSSRAERGHLTAMLRERGEEVRRIGDALAALEAARSSQERQLQQVGGQVSTLAARLEDKLDRLDFDRHKAAARSEAPSLQDHNAALARLGALEARAGADRALHRDASAASLGDAGARAELGELWQLVRAEQRARERLQGALELQGQQLQNLAATEQRALWDRDVGQSGKDYETQVQLLHKAITAQESALRREIEDRQKECRRLSDAVESVALGRGMTLAPSASATPRAREELRRQTPTSRSPKAVAARDGDVESEAYLPFPSQPLSSFLRAVGGRGSLALPEGDDGRVSPLGRQGRETPGDRRR